MKVMLTLDGSKAHIELDCHEGFRLFGAMAELHKLYMKDLAESATMEDEAFKGHTAGLSTDRIASNVEDISFYTQELATLSAMMFAMIGDHEGKPAQDQAYTFFVDGFGLHRAGEGVRGNA